MSAVLKRTCRASKGAARTDCMPPPMRPAVKVVDTGGGGYTRFVCCDVGSWREERLCRYAVYRTAPMLQDVSSNMGNGCPNFHTKYSQVVVAALGSE